MDFTSRHRIVQNLGEFELLEKIVSPFCDSAKIGNFEDANLMNVGDSWFINNTDSMPNHLPLPSPFDTPEKSKFYSAGWIAVMTTINDLAVSGAQKYMGFSTRPQFHPLLSIKDVKSFTKGVAEACACCGIPYTGGDTAIKNLFDKKGKPRLLECTTNAVGFLGQRENYISRNTAHPGDLVVLTARSGVGWAKLVELTEEGFNFESKSYQKFSKRYEKEMKQVEISPTIPLRAFAECARKQLLTSATDLSDGLMLIHKTSFVPYGLGLELILAPEHVSESAREVCEKRGFHPVNSIISEGLDAPNMHMMTILPKDIKEVERIFLKDGRTLYTIGKINQERSIHCTYEGKRILIENIFSDGSLDPKRASQSLIWYKGNKNGN